MIVESSKKPCCRYIAQIVCLLILLIPSFAICTTASSGLPEDDGLFFSNHQSQNGEEIEVYYSFPAPEIVQKQIPSITGEHDTYVSVSMTGVMQWSETGKPVLPFKTARILLPFGSDVQDVIVTCGNRIVLPGTYMVEPGQQPIILSSEETVAPTEPDFDLYESSMPYPGNLYSDLSIQHKSGYTILQLNLHPIEYLPRQRQLSYCDSMTVNVITMSTKEIQPVTIRGVLQDRERIGETVDNPAMLKEIPIIEDSVGSKTTFLSGSRSYEYVVITNELLASTPGTYNFQYLVEQNIDNGVVSSGTLVTTEWIYSNYQGARPDGGQDDPTRIRNFIIDAYANWGTSYVLLGGDSDGANVGGESEDQIVPCRGFYANGDYNVPSDMYYGCLDGTFDYDADGYYGEPTDGPGGGEVDLYAEVYIGRAPADSGTEVANFVRKNIEYQNTPVSDANTRNVYMVGEYLGFGGPSNYGGTSKDEVRDGSDFHGYTTIGFEDSVYAPLFDVSTLYERDMNWYQSDIVNIINNNVHLINHLGHANVGSLMQLTNSVVDTLSNDDLYFVGYSQGCYCGSFDNRGTSSSSYYNYDCIVEHLTMESGGAVAFVANSRYGYGRSNSTDGPSQHYDREFWDAILGEHVPSIGMANHDSKEDNAGRVSESVERFCLYETNLFGDPALGIRGVGQEGILYQSHEIDDSTGNGDGQLNPGETIQLSMTLENTELVNATGVETILSTSDPDITITDNSESWGTIVAGGSQTKTGVFSLEVAASVSDQHMVSFLLAASGTIPGTTAPPWYSGFRIAIEAPDFSVGSFTVDDSSGNGNGIAEPGETIDVLVSTANTGHADAQATIGTLQCTRGSEYVTINSGHHAFGTFGSLSSGTASFNISISPVVPSDVHASFEYTVASGSYSASRTYVTGLGPVTLPWVEDFEGVGSPTAFNSDTDFIDWIPDWSYDQENPSGRLRFAAGPDFYRSGSRAATLDSTAYCRNYLILELNLSDYQNEDVDLSFWYMDHSDSSHIDDKVWVRGSRDDAWVEIYNLDPSYKSDGVWYEVRDLDIDGTLAQNAQSVSSTFQVRFGQYGGYMASSIHYSDGITFDDVSVYLHPSAESDIISNGNEPSGIAYTNYQSESISSIFDGVKAWSFTLRDGGVLGFDNDIYETSISDLTIMEGAQDTVSNWSDTIRDAALFRASDNSLIKNATVITEDRIQFSDLDGLTSTDDSVESYNLYLSFHQIVEDNVQFQFKITSNNVSAVHRTSRLTPFTTFSDTSNQKNLIAITATEYSFMSIPGSVYPNDEFAVTVCAIDANGSLDMDNDDPVTLGRYEGSGSLSSIVGLTQNLTNGSNTWNGLTYDTLGQFSIFTTGVLPQSVSGTIRCLAPPQIEATPTSFAFDVYANSVAGATLTLANNGQGTLMFSLDVEEETTHSIQPTIYPDSYYDELPKYEEDTRYGFPVELGKGGQDQFGYRWIDSNEPGGPSFDYIDIQTTGTLITGLGDDNYTGPFPIGFDFPFYEDSHSQFYVQSNGVINFNPQYISLGNNPIPYMDSYNNLLAWCWDDLYHMYDSQVYYQNLGGKLVIQFVNYGECCSSLERVNAEVVLYPNGRVVYQYDSFTDGFDIDGCTVGIENIDGTDGLQVAYNTYYLHDSLAVMFTASHSWVSPFPMDGMVLSGQSIDVNIAVDAARIGIGEHDASIIISSNDPDENEVAIPVHINVGTPSGKSDIVSSGSEPANIDYLAYQSSYINSPYDALKVWSFTLRDGGNAGSDEDDIGTGISSVVISSGSYNSVSISSGSSNGMNGWDQTIRKAAIFRSGDDTLISQVYVTATEQIVFNGLTQLITEDDSQQTYDLYLTFESTITDNEQFQFEITDQNIIPSSSSSYFTGFKAKSDVAGDKNRLEVAATHYQFETVPNIVHPNFDFGTSLTARDIYGNIDYDESRMVTLSSINGSGTLSSVSGLVQNMVSGSCAWTDLQYNTHGTFNIQASGSVSQVSSSDISCIPIADIDVTTEGFDEVLRSGDVITRSLKIKNTGPGTLNFSFMIRNGTTSYASNLFDVHKLSAQKSTGNDFDIYTDFQLDGMDDVEVVGESFSQFKGKAKDLVISDGPIEADLLDLTGVVIAQDLSHGGGPYADYLKADLVSRGATIEYIYSGPLTETLLDTIDILWLYEYGNYNWTNEEITAIQSWVQNGAGLIVDGDQNSELESLVAGMGIIYAGINGAGGNTTNIVQHSITENVNTVYINGPVNSLTTVPPGYPIVFDFLGVPQIACSEYGSGAVMVMADDYLPDGYISYADNRLMFNQAFDWLALGGSCSWLDFDPRTGNVSAYSEIDVILTFDTTDVELGEYDATISINSNDPDESPILIPVHVLIAEEMVYYVDDDAAGLNSGLSWSDAFTDVQNALDVAISGDEIWVASGTYTPGDVRTDTFMLNEGIGLYGGFSGTETSLNQRSWQENPTILSGDIGTAGNNADNCYHVVSCLSELDLAASAMPVESIQGKLPNPQSNSGTINVTVLDGFTITGGNADGDYTGQYGAGIYSYFASPRINNCIISGNSSVESGGGMANFGSISNVTNCVFIENTAPTGGGMYNFMSPARITHCVFSDNTADTAGGAVFNTAFSEPEIANCILWGNSPDEISNNDASPTVSCCDIQGGYPGKGNLNVSPHFVGGGDFHLNGTSSCIDSGTNSSEVLPLSDYDGNPRIMDGNGDGFAVPDMGIDEARCTLTVIIEPASAGVTNAVPSGPVYIPGAEVTLTATSLPQFDFVEWKGGIAGKANPIDVKVDSDTTVVAGFVYTGTIIYVNGDASGFNSGSSWDDAFSSLKDALDLATAGREIWVAEGTYTPGTGRDDSFQMKNNVAIYGGFPSIGNPVWTDRDWRQNRTVLSGDIGTKGESIDNCYHVICNPRGTNLNNSAVLDGFTISSGNANGLAPHDSGGGLFTDSSNPLIANCTFSENLAGKGGGMACYSADPVIINCLVTGNTVTQEGGGLYNSYSAPILVNCTFYGNMAYYGGGVYNYFSSPFLTNCILWNDSSNYYSYKEIYNSSSYPIIKYCDVEGGVQYPIPPPTPTPTPTFPATTETKDISEIINVDANGNINADPGFINPDSGDFHLLPSSPCIDSGTNHALNLPEIDYEGDPRIVGGQVDMGVDETPGNFPAVVTLPATQVGANSVVLQGNLVDMGATGYISVHFEWDTYPGEPYNYQSTPQIMSGTGMFQIEITELMDGQTYFFRAVATGNNSRNGIQLAFTTVNIIDIICVNGSASIPGNGKGWDNAYTDLQQAIYSANTGDMVWVAAGTYTPGLSRYDSFSMKNGVGIYGGFPSSGSPSFNDRNWQNYETVLSGEIGNPGTVVDNCYRVVNNHSGLGLDPTAVLDGFTITGANGSSGGAGMYNSYASPTITNCIFMHNSTSGYGGGMYNYGSGERPIITNCTFFQNSSSSYGGGMYNRYCSPVITNCTFFQNSSGNYGGGLYNYSSSAVITNSIFWENTAPAGSQIYSSNSYPVITYCDVQGNYVGIGNINQNPRLVNPNIGNFHLLPNSPCIDEGNNSAMNIPAEDFEGDPRVMNGTVDMGVDEFISVTYQLTINKSGSGTIDPFVGDHDYCEGQPVDIRATANTNWHFVNWTGDTGEITDPNSAITTITMNADCSIVANFEAGIEWNAWDYDSNHDSTISKQEALNAVVNFFAGQITKQQALEVIVLFFG